MAIARASDFAAGRNVAGRCRNRCGRVKRRFGGLPSDAAVASSGFIFDGRGRCIFRVGFVRRCRRVVVSASVELASSDSVVDFVRLDGRDGLTVVGLVAFVRRVVCVSVDSSTGMSASVIGLVGLVGFVGRVLRVRRVVCGLVTSTAVSSVIFCGTSESRATGLSFTSWLVLVTIAVVFRVIFDGFGFLVFRVVDTSVVFSFETSSSVGLVGFVFLVRRDVCGIESVVCVTALSSRLRATGSADVLLNFGSLTGLSTAFEYA